MSRPLRPAALPVRDGVSASCAAVGDADAGAALLDFLARRLPAVSRSEWAQRLMAGEVLDAHGQPLAPMQRCLPGQRVFYYRQIAREPMPADAPRIVFQDEWLVVADKPHFMPVTPSGPFIQRSLMVQLKQRLGLADLNPLHRIDRDTAGLVLFAVQPHTRDAYQALFRERRVRKRYQAVAAHPPGLSLPRTHRSRIVDDPERFFLCREEPGTPNSETELALARVFELPGLGAHALYELHPVTGKRHQLRLHMMALGMPILGDAFYPRVLHAEGEADDTARPLQLLARAIAFTDPVTGQARQFTSSLHLAAARGLWPSNENGCSARPSSASSYSF